MKRFYLLLFLITVIVVYHAQSSGNLSERNREDIPNELSFNVEYYQRISDNEELEIVTEIDSLMKIVFNGYNSGDLNLAFKFCNKSPSFRYVGMDGTIEKFSDFERLTTEIYEQVLQKYRLNVAEHEIIILNNGLVLSLVNYNFDVTMKSGERYVYKNAVTSFLWQKINGSWKIIFESESGLPPEKYQEQ